MTLTLNNGSTDVDSVVIHCNPTACFTLSPSVACEGTTFNFSSSCTNSGNGNPLTYLWDFGNGASSTQPNPSYNGYNAGGCYSGVLVVTNNWGCQDDTTIQNAVCVTEPNSSTDNIVNDLLLSK